MIEIYPVFAILLLDELMLRLLLRRRQQLVLLVEGQRGIYHDEVGLCRRWC